MERQLLELSGAHQTCQRAWRALPVSSQRRSTGGAPALCVCVSFLSLLFSFSRERFLVVFSFLGFFVFFVGVTLFLEPNALL